MQWLAAVTTRNHISYAITALKGAIKLLRKTPDGPLDADLSDVIHALENEVERLGMLKEECREYVRIAKAADT